MRIKIVKDHKQHRKGQTLEVSPNEAFGLIDCGVAVLSKDLTPDDYKQAGGKNGKSTQLRTYKSK
jgi:hypothetical protein